jgi:hypothetical protein
MTQSRPIADGDSGHSQASGGSPSADFGAFSDERERIDRITDRLDQTEDLTERADLGGELVRSISRYEDTFERALLPHMQESRSGVLNPLESDREDLRVLLDEINRRTMGVDPRNVHAADGQGFEDTLEAVVMKVRSLLEVEDREIASLIASLPTQERRNVIDEVRHAFRSASERPRPPRTAVGRFISNVHVKLDHNLEDVSTPRHPGADTVKG